MFIEIASLAGGFLSRFLPVYFQYLGQKARDKHELEMMDKSIAIANLRQKGKLLSQQMENDIASERIDASLEIQLRKLLKDQYNKTGLKFADAYNSSMKSVIATWFLLFWGWIKYQQVEFLGKYVAPETSPLSVFSDIFPLMWDQSDKAIMFAIIGFFFSDRMLKAYGR